MRKSFDYPREIIINNNNITLNLLESIRTLKINPIVLICSTSEYMDQLKKKDLPITEKNRINPANLCNFKTFQDYLSQIYYKNYNLKK